VTQDSVSMMTSSQILDDDDRDSPRNVGFMQTPDMADSVRKLYRI